MSSSLCCFSYKNKVNVSPNSMPDEQIGMGDGGLEPGRNPRFRPVVLRFFFSHRDGMTSQVHVNALVAIASYQFPIQ